MQREFILSMMNRKIVSYQYLQIEDDADRYLTMLEDRDYPAMTVVEMEDHVIIGACQDRGQRFSIITPDDFLIPPNDLE